MFCLVVGLVVVLFCFCFVLFCGFVVGLVVWVGGVVWDIAFVMDLAFNVGFGFGLFIVFCWGCVCVELLIDLLSSCLYMCFVITRLVGCFVCLLFY